MFLHGHTSARAVTDSPFSTAPRIALRRLPQKVQTLTFRARVGGRRRRRGEPQKVQTVARLLANVGYLPQKVQTLT